jgi:hypothetical protein
LLFQSVNNKTPAEGDFYYFLSKATKVQLNKATTKKPGSCLNSNPHLRAPR